MELARRRKARIRRAKFLNALKLVMVALVAAVVTSFLTYKIVSRPVVLLSPLPDAEDCIQLNRVVNPSIEKNQNEKSIEPTRTVKEEQGTSPNLRESDNIVTASYYTTDYCERFNPSCLTASGEVFTNEGLTAACDDRFKLGTKFLLTSDQGSVVVTCNDRGSFSEKYGRSFDLTPTAFSKLSPLSKGVVTVAYKVVN